MQLEINQSKSIARTIPRLLKFFTKADKAKIQAAIVLQISLSFLDLVGVGLLGVLGALAVYGLESRPPGGNINSILSILNLSNSTLQFQALVLGLLASILLVVRTLLSIFFTRKVLFFLSRRSALICQELTAKVFRRPLTFFENKSRQEILYSLTTGTNLLTLGVVGVLISITADLSVLIVLILGMSVVDPVVAISTFLFFLAVSFSLHRLMTVRARKLGEISQNLSIKSSEDILEALNSYREMVVKNRPAYYIRKIGQGRLEIADSLAEVQFLPNISKYVLEVSLVLGTLLIAGAQFFLHDATRAVSSMIIFLAAGSRIAPAVMRIQQGLVQISGNIGGGNLTLTLLEELAKDSNEITKVDPLTFEHEGFIPTIELNNVDFCYPGGERVIKNLSIKLNAGETVAIVGPSGAGKSTLVDLILGVLKPSSGNILISGESPLTAISKWPGSISYMPQEVQISNGTLAENISLGYPSHEVPVSALSRAIRTAQIENLVEDFPSGMETQVGENGTKLSGGQKQRLGIARTVFTMPKLLVFDEATSSLDAETEASVTKAIKSLKGRVTILMIAHRLSSVIDADLVIYIENGQIISTGSFAKVRKEVPNFDKQAQLSGL
jgi:ATP-binding cassette, subfamily B, bacterial PglK